VRWKNELWEYRCTYLNYHDIAELESK